MIWENYVNTREEVEKKKGGELESLPAVFGITSSEALQLSFSNFYCIIFLLLFTTSLPLLPNNNPFEICFTTFSKCYIVLKHVGTWF